MAKKQSKTKNQTPTLAIANKLNVLLSSYQVFYNNVLGFHWNINGKSFFELHLKFEELYKDAFLKIDETAERILTIGYVPLHSLSDYLKKTTIREITGITDGKRAAEIITDGIQQLLITEKEILELSKKAEDEGTSALMSDFIKQQEKLVWMYGAFLK